MTEARYYEIKEKMAAMLQEAAYMKAIVPELSEKEFLESNKLLEKRKAEFKVILEELAEAGY